MPNPLHFFFEEAMEGTFSVRAKKASFPKLEHIESVEVFHEKHN